MSDLDNDGLVVQEDWKSKYEALLKDKKLFEERLEERVTCPVCLEVPTRAPMYSCANGHLVCASCYQGPQSDCSLCRTKMNKTVSLLATTVIENIEHRCKFETDGCKVKTPAGKVEEHKRSCSFRPVKCPSLKCDKKVPFEHVMSHVLNECKESFKTFGVLDSSSCNLSFTLPANNLAVTFSVKPIKWNGQFFFLNMKVENEHHRRFYVQMLGTEEECEKYTVEINLKGEAGKRVTTFCDNPLSIEAAEDDLNAGGVMVSNAMLKKICVPVVDHPNKLQFSVSMTFATVTKRLRVGAYAGLRIIP